MEDIFFVLLQALSHIEQQNDQPQHNNRSKRHEKHRFSGDMGAYIWYDDLCFLCCVFSFPEHAFSSILGRFISVCPTKKVLDWRKGFVKEELIVDDIPIFEKIFIARVCLCGTSDIRT